MTDKQLTEVIEGNRIIAELLGWEFDIKPDDFGGELLVYNDGTLRFRGEKPSYLNQFLSTGLNYHQDWNALMPVVEKISKLPLLNHDNTPCTDPIDTCYPITFNMPDREQEGNVLFRFKGFSLHSEKTLIGAAWKAVVEVAEYHLNQNKQS